MMVTEFFMPMNPPTVTHQEKQVRLANHRPEEKYTEPIELVTKWCFPRGSHRNGEYRTSKPDTDNLQKLLKDCMTATGFWKDDALVVREITEKFWAEIPGIYIRITGLG